MPSPVKPAPVARSESVTPAAQVPTAAPKAQPEPVAQSATPVSGSGPYTIQAGAYAETTNRDQAMKKLRQLGFEARSTPVTRTQAMTRLLIGVYATDVARAKAKELAPRAPKLFILKQGDQLAVYAGSFSDPNKAKDAAAELARRGVQVSEERAEVESTLWRLTFGGFADAASAKAAAAKAKAAGLEARVIRNP
jgi:cell division protein FtsN